MATCIHGLSSPDRCRICEYETHDAVPVSEEELARLRAQVSAGFKLAAELVSLPTDDKDRIERNRICDAVYKWRSTIDRVAIHPNRKVTP